MYQRYITKTCQYNFDPLKPHYYIVKLGFTRLYTICLISAQKHRLWVLVRTPLMFWAEIWKLPKFFIGKFSFVFVVKFSIHFNRRVFVMRLKTKTHLISMSLSCMPVNLAFLLSRLPCECLFFSPDHYENTPIYQIYWKFYNPKRKDNLKNSDIFIFLLKT